MRTDKTNMGRRSAHLLARLLRLTNDSRGQFLPLALAAMGIGAVLVMPFLVDASVNLLASRHVDAAIKDEYSADSGVEWALWRLKNDPELTADTAYSEAPLQPTPAALNDAPFPTTEVRRVADAGMSRTSTPAWQSGSGAKCYDFTSSELGNVYGIVDVQATSVWMTVLPEAAPCARPAGLGPMIGSSPYEAQYSNVAPGPYKLYVETSPVVTGTVTINYPVAAYDISSTRNSRTTVCRATASEDGVQIISWQLE
jgi:hypothetical protein